MNFIYALGYRFFKTVARVFYGYRVIHAERLLEDGPAIVASNHTSFLDPPMVGVAFRSAIYYLGRKTLFKNGLLGWIYRKWNSIPIDQDRPEVGGLKKVLRLLKEGERLLIFPEGARSWDGSMGPGQAGVGLLVAKSRAPVIPVRLFGTYEALPRGASRPRKSKITLVVGEPLYFSDEELKRKDKANYQRISDRIMNAIGELKVPAE